VYLNIFQTKSKVPKVHASGAPLLRKNGKSIKLIFGGPNVPRDASRLPYMDFHRVHLDCDWLSLLLAVDCRVFAQIPCQLSQFRYQQKLLLLL